jgi:carbamoyltransferase
MLIAGISDLAHHSAAALLNARGPLVAVEEEKLTRAPGAGGVPRLSFQFCLRHANGHAGEIGALACAGRPSRAALRRRQSTAGVGSHPSSGRDVLSANHDELQALRDLVTPTTPLLRFEHHLCHAASAFYPSEFDRSLILTLDESGDLWSGLIASGAGADIKIIRAFRFPHSLGWLYSRLTELIGFRAGRDERKTQWLGKDGASPFVPMLRRLMSVDDEGMPRLADPLLSSQARGDRCTMSALRAALDLPADRDLDSDVRAAVARSAQVWLEETVVNLAEHYRAATGARHLCVAGGVFQNVLLVRALEERTGYEEIYVQPVPGNPGTALGAAWLARRRLSDRHAWRERDPIREPFLGPGFTDYEIKSVLDNCKLVCEYIPDDDALLARTVRLLAGGRTVAWFQGRMELGHRALGHRTILASPFSPYVVENLNQFIKHREDFHPFALAVPSERAGEWFDCSRNCRVLGSVGRVKPGTIDWSAFTFGGNQIRVHTADSEAAPLFSALLRKFGAQAPAPVLVNTSFNLFGEPLVCDPREAIRSTYCSGIDALVIGHFLVVK